MSDSKTAGQPIYFVQPRQCVVHGVERPGFGVQRIRFSPGDEIPAGTLDPQDAARLLAAGTIAKARGAAVFPQPTPPGSNPGAVGFQGGQVQGPTY